MCLGSSLENESKSTDAIQVYKVFLDHFSNLSSTISGTIEYQSWTERVLSRYCMLCSRYIAAHAAHIRSLISPTASISPASILTPFRAYAKSWHTGSSTGTAKAGSSVYVWRAYYDALSTLLQNGIVQPVFESKMKNSVELKNVEATYEAMLLKEVSFPRADQVNTQVESWADQVMADWRIMSSSTWREEDLGQLNKLTLGRGVLDVSDSLADLT